MVVAVLELCKVYIKLDQPNTALDVYRGYSERHPVRIGPDACALTVL